MENLDLEGKCKICGATPEYVSIDFSTKPTMHFVYCSNCGHGALDLNEIHVAVKNFNKMD